MKTASLIFLAVPLLASCLFTGCTPARQWSSEQTFYSTGQPNIRVDVTPPLHLAAQGLRWASTKSSVSITQQPYTSFAFAAYTDADTGPVQRSAHVIVSSLPSDSWEFMVESWKGPDRLLLSSDNIISGKRWTIQMMPVFSQQDWFSSLWTANRRDIPLVWLAKRWSNNPTADKRVVAEYREAASPCIFNALASTDGDGKAVFLRPDAQTLWAHCQADIDAFSKRADQAFTLSPLKGDAMRAAPVSPRFVMPEGAPDIQKLVGDVEPMERDDGE